jgi:YD repeat-containing protein
VFGIQIDASSMPSGVYDWSLDLWFYDEGGLYYHLPAPYHSQNDNWEWRPLDIVNHDDSPYGAGWSMIADERLVIQENLPGQPDGVALVSGNNDVTWFYDPTDGAYRRQENPTNFSALQKDDNGTSGIATDDVYILTDPNGTVSTFNYQGLLQTVVDRNGNTLAAYTYGTGGDANKIVNIEDAAGRDTHYQYDSNLLIAVTDFYGTAGA